MSEVAEIARGLTEAQRTMILHGRDSGRGWDKVVGALQRKGILDQHPGFTSLGVTVHDYLLENPK